MESEWNNFDTKMYIQYGNCFVPHRQKQIDLVCDLIRVKNTSTIVDLCCGQGYLSEALLKKFPDIEVIAMDGSEEMLNLVESRLSPYQDRLKTKLFDLPANDWRQFEKPIDAFVSSLAIHHLDGNQKENLFSDLFQLLTPTGSLIIADLILPTTQLSFQATAKSWDEVTKQQSLDIYGDLSAFEAFQNLKWNYYHYPNEDTVDKPSPILDQLIWLEKSGYTNVEVFWLLAGHAIYGGYKSETKK